MCSDNLFTFPVHLDEKAFLIFEDTVYYWFIWSLFYCCCSCFNLFFCPKVWREVFVNYTTDIHSQHLLFFLRKFLYVTLVVPDLDFHQALDLLHVDWKTFNSSISSFSFPSSWIIGPDHHALAYICFNIQQTRLVQFGVLSATRFSSFYGSHFASAPLLGQRVTKDKQHSSQPSGSDNRLA